MIPSRRGAICTLMILVLLAACTPDASEHDGGPSAAETHTTTTTSTNEPTYTYTSRPRHSSKSMTPREVVNAPDADLVIVALAPGDPDVRLSAWTARCRWCPDRPDGRGGSLGPPTFTGMALTTDGYETATYVRPRSPQLGYTVLSPRDDVFLLNDAANGREWLVDVDDGTEHRVARVDSELRPADSRLWFECGIAGGDSSTWCSLDVDTATAYAWPAAWSGSAVPPYVGDEPWGWEPPGWSLTSTGTFEDDPDNTAPTTTRVAHTRPGGTPTAAGSAVRSPRTRWAPSVDLRRASRPTGPGGSAPTGSTSTPVATAGPSGSWRPARHPDSAGGCS